MSDLLDHYKDEIKEQNKHIDELNKYIGMLEYKSDELLKINKEIKSKKNKVQSQLDDVLTNSKVLRNCIDGQDKMIDKQEKSICLMGYDLDNLKRLLSKYGEIKGNNFCQNKLNDHDRIFKIDLHKNPVVINDSNRHLVNDNN